MKKLAFVLLLPVLILGCSGSQSSSLSLESEWSSAKAASKALAEAPAPTLRPAAEPLLNLPASENPSSKAAPRKIVYTAGIDLLVGDLSAAQTKLDALTKQYHGLVAQSAITSRPGAPRSANWRVRVPVDGFNDFVNKVAEMGEATRNTIDSDDITDKYYDFQVRMENKKIQVERLQKIIKEQVGKISEVLEAERELGRVTTELEELKGTLKLWENQTALATVNITIQERSRYVAPIAPSFAGNVKETFSGSVQSLVSFGENLALVVVALAPWLPLIVVVAFLARFGLRRTWPRIAASMKGK